MEATKKKEKDNVKINRWFRIGVSISVLLVGLYVSISPELVYAPTPRTILYLLVACLPAILFASEAAASFEMRLPGFIASAGGAAAVTFLGLFLLSHFSKPDTQIAVFHIYHEDGQEVIGLERDGAVSIPITNTGLSVTKFVDNNTIILIFPTQVAECDIVIRPVDLGPAYKGTVKYAGNREYRLILGKDLT